MDVFARRVFFAFALALVLASDSPLHAAPLLPGTGEVAMKVGDDFEDPEWTYHYNRPKSSQEQDQQTRAPTGYSANRRWFEAALRGQPDLIKRVPTPEGGLPDSEGSLLLRTLQSGVPGRPSFKNQQDDLIANVKDRMGGMIPTSWNPSVVVRVYLPPFEEWENRTGNSFGFRAGVRGSKDRSRSLEEYWPGIFIWFNSETNSRDGKDSARLLIRGNRQGREIPGPDIYEPGWWTLGMSFSADGMIHYYAREGTGDLTEEDHLTSQYPYGFRCQQFETFFFDVINRDDGRSWSTPWVIDDPTLYYVPPRRSR